MGVIKCCHHCTERAIVNGVRCHSWCERYKKERAKRDEMLEAEYRRKNEGRYYEDTIVKKMNDGVMHRKRRGRI